MPGDTQVHIHQAPWVVPVSGPSIIDGGVAVSNKRIVAVDTISALKRRYPNSQVSCYPGSALTPAMVNAHIHVELSHLGELSLEPYTGSFTQWITSLLALRDRLGATGEHVTAAAAKIVKQQYDSGVNVLCDIGNTGINSTLGFNGVLLAFKEYLGLASASLQHSLTRLDKELDRVCCTGHAPYSTHPELLQTLKRRATEKRHILPLHVAEPSAEIDMIRHGAGEMVDFVKERGFWDTTFQPAGPECHGSVQYLDQLGVLDAQTLCVHGIQVQETEVALMAKRDAKVCLCPGSNRYLGVGRAPLSLYLDNGLLPALGTDSLASNPELSLWREMQILATEHPAIAPEVLFRMATQGGAAALGVEASYGSLQPGMDGDFLSIPLDDAVNNEASLYHYLVTTGSSIKPSRLQTAA